MGFRIWRTVLNTLIVPMNHHYTRVMSKLMEADGEENDLIKQGGVITKSNLTWNQFDCQQGLIKFVHGALITIRFCVDSRPSQEPKDHSNIRPLIGHNAPVLGLWLADISPALPVPSPTQQSVSRTQELETIFYWQTSPLPNDLTSRKSDPSKFAMNIKEKETWFPWLWPESRAEAGVDWSRSSGCLVIHQRSAGGNWVVRDSQTPGTRRHYCP